ncbi:MAG: NUDIX domain-containing protein [Nocardioidaceae bacterium]|nr:NUDIX domain-containing protein [Nocardioidaceae bacterium]
MQLVVGAAVVRDGRVLLARRTGDGWEFPGGKVEDDEEPAAALVREVAEELGCVVAVTGWLDGTVEIRPGLALRVATAVLLAGEPIPSAGEHDAVWWHGAGGLGSLDWLAADRPFVPEITALLRGSSD